jgi:hypothetical protein
MTSGIVNYIGTLVEDLHGNIIDPIGYQTVLYVTLALYIRKKKHNLFQKD